MKQLIPKIILMMVFLSLPLGCATSKATLPSGLIIENMAYKHVTYDPTGKIIISQEALIPVKDKTASDIAALINSILPSLGPWLMEPGPPATSGPYPIK